MLSDEKQFVVFGQGPGFVVDYLFEFVYVVSDLVEGYGHGVVVCYGLFAFVLYLVGYLSIMSYTWSCMADVCTEMLSISPKSCLASVFCISGSKTLPIL